MANALRDQGDIDERESFIDASFASAKGGGEQIGKTKRGKGVKILAIVDRHGLPLSVSTHAANHHEVTLVQLSFNFYKPEHLIGDRAYDSDRLDTDLKQDGVVTRSWLGIYIQPVDDERTQAAGLSPGQGALVSELVIPGPGAKAGLAVGDIILALDGRPVDHRSLPWLASTAAPGRPLELTVLRNGGQRKVDLVPEKMPD